MFAELHNNLIHYTSRGEGPPIVFVHGLGGSANVWHGTIDALAQHHHCIALDLRGHGRRQGQFTIDGWAKDVAALIRHLELPAVTVVGHSMGTLIAQRLALTEPDLVESVALLGGILHPATHRPGLRPRRPGRRGWLDEPVDPWLEGAGSRSPRRWQAAGLLRELFLRNDLVNTSPAARWPTPPRSTEQHTADVDLTGATDRSTPLAMSRSSHPRELSRSSRTWVTGHRSRRPGRSPPPSSSSSPDGGCAAVGACAASRSSRTSTVAGS